MIPALESSTELTAEAQARADAIIAEHVDGLIIVATGVYDHRRVADELAMGDDDLDLVHAGHCRGDDHRRSRTLKLRR
jgi:hypothetical protein